jgi:hypothetical protein
MSSEELNAQVQIIANVAVIASILFLAVQARLGIRMLKDAAERNHMDKHQSVSRMMAENPQLAELWVRGSKLGIMKLSDAERAQFVNFYTYVLRIWEELFLQHRRGVIEEIIFTSNVRILADTQVTPGAEDAWSVRRHLFTPAFAAFYDDMRASSDARPLYDIASPRPVQ